MIYFSNLRSRAEKMGSMAFALAPLNYIFFVLSISSLGFSPQARYYDIEEFQIRWRSLQIPTREKLHASIFPFVPAATNEPSYRTLHGTR